MAVSWPLVVFGVLLALGFGALVWRHRSSTRGERSWSQARVVIDILGLGITIVVVGTLAMTQVAAPPEPMPTPTPREKAVVLPPSPTPTVTPSLPPSPAETATTDVPATPTPPPPVVKYAVQQGDTLASIAAQFGVTVEALMAANGLTSEILQIGQELVIPVQPTPTPGPATEEQPAEAPPPAVVTVGQPYTVQQGDTFNLIAQRFGVSVQTLLDYNPGVQPEALRPGQTILIPVQATVTPVPTEEPTATPEAAEPTPAPEPTATRGRATPRATRERATPTATATPTEMPTPTATPVPPTATPVPVQRYTIQQGDTLNLIAQRFGVSVSQILAANPGLNPDALQVGQEIIIPTGAAPSAPQPATTQYTIQPRDTLNSIAQRFGVSVSQILAANPGLNPEALRIGQVIVIPNQ